MTGSPGMRRALVRALTWALIAGVAWFSLRYARSVDWPQVGRALQDTPASVLGAAAVLAAASHVIYSTYDLLGRRYTGHRLPTAQVMAVTFVSYAFNLNLGSLVGGIAFRLRLYSRLGLPVATITRVLTLSMLTNWLGYLVMAGAVFAGWPPPLPPGWPLAGNGLRLLGLAMLAVVALYLALCLGRRVPHFTVRGHELPVPGPALASAQLLLSCANWSVMAGVVWVLLQGRVPYPGVMAVLLVAAVAGVITHVPAGLGVLEAVFVALLSHRVPEPQLLAALLAYRALYYLAPWALATAAYLAMEARARRAPPPGAPAKS